MKLLCVEHDDHGVLRVGEIYTETGRLKCKCSRVWVWVAEAKFGGKFDNCLCGMTVPHLGDTFAARRFVPWNPDQLGVTEDEVRKLYQPDLVVTP